MLRSVEAEAQRPVLVSLSRVFLSLTSPRPEESQKTVTGRKSFDPHQRICKSKVGRRASPRKVGSLKEGRGVSGRSTGPLGTSEVCFTSAT